MKKNVTLEKITITIDLNKLGSLFSNKKKQAIAPTKILIKAKKTRVINNCKAKYQTFTW